jgi:hypothetical protein
MKSPVSLRDVCGGRAGSTQQLIAESMLFNLRQSRNDLFRDEKPEGSAIFASTPNLRTF